MANNSFFQVAVERANKKPPTTAERLTKAYNDNTQRGSTPAVETPVLDSAVKPSSGQAFSPASSLEEFMGILPTPEVKNDGLDGTPYADVVRSEWKRMGVDNARDYAEIRKDYAYRGLRSGVVGGARDTVNYMGNTVQQGNQRFQLESAVENAVAQAMASGNTGGKTYEELYSQYLKELQGKFKEEPLRKTVDWGEAYDQESERIAQELGVNEEARKDYQFNQAIGRMAPAIAVSATGNLAGGGMTLLGAGEAAKYAYTIGRVLSSAATFTSAAGGAYEDAKAHGIDDDQAMTYAAAVGAIELATEAFSSGLGKVGGKKIGTGGVTDDFVEALAKRASSDPNVQNAIIYAGGVVGEGFEEWLSEWGDYAANRLLVGYDDRTVKDVWGDSKESFMQGAMMSSLLNITQLMQRGVPPKEAIRQGVDETAAEAGISPAEQVSPAAQTMARAATQGSVQETAPAQTDISPAARTMADVLTGKQNQNTGSSEPVNAGRVTTIRNPYQGNVPTQEYTAPPSPITITAEASAAAQQAYSNAVAESSASNTPLRTVLSKLYSKFKGPKGVAVNGMQFDGRQYTVDVPNSVPAKLASQGQTAEAFVLLDNLNEIISNGEYVGSGTALQPDGSGKKQIIRYDYFETPIDMNGEKIVRWDVEVVPGSNNYKTHRLVNIEIDPIAGTDRPAQFGRDLPTTGSNRANAENSGASRSFNVPQGTLNVNPEGVETRLSQTAETVRDAAVTPDAVKQSINENIENGGYRYIPESNADAVASARAGIKESGYDSVLRSWTADVARGKTSNDLFATGAVLYNEAIQSGNTKLALDILTDYQLLGTNTAQGLQAASIIKNLTPDGQLYIMQKDVKKLNDSLSETAKRKAAPKTKDADVTAAVSEARAAAARKTAEKFAVDEKNAGKTSYGKIVKGGMAELGQTFREIASQPNATKEQIRQDLADQLAIRYAVSPETAKQISDTVMAEYDTQLRDAMTAEVKKRFAPKDVKKTGEKAVIDKIIEAVNLGAFDTEYASAAAEKLFGNGTVRIDPELADAFINAKDAAARDAAVTAIQQDIAAQLPASFAEKWRALRYLNMLGNVKTQVRNLLGNTAMMGLTGAKNTMLTGVEYLANKLSGGKYERNTAFGVRDYMDAAKKYYKTVDDFVNGDSKYMESNMNDSFSRGVQDARKIFGFKPLEAYRKATQWAMTQGDVLFIRPQFARSLSGYLKARGMDANTFTQIVNGDIQATTEQQNLIHNATEYAAREAQEATFHDSNEISKAVSKVGKGWPAPVRAIIEGIFPFRKTPANVLVRAEEYSPLGVVNTAVNAYQAAKGLKGKTAADVINSFSKTATGTSLFALGALLAKAGLARGKEDDEEQAAFDKMQGKQDFSVVLPDGSSYTIDWLSPASVPFFMGAAFSDALSDGEITIGEFLKALNTLTEPMIEMSMLQGVNDALDQIRYADNALVNFAMNQMVNYVSQAIGNSLYGQIERITEKNRETTYTASDTAEGRTWERTLGKALNKIPGLEYNQVEYVDAWGRTQSSGSAAERAFSNLLSPGYIGKNRSTEVDNELQRLYDAGQTNVFPSRISMTQTVNVYRNDGRKTEERRLTKDEYVQYQKVMGQTSLELVKDLMKSPVYQGMSDEAKASAISEIYGYAKRMAAMAVEPSAKYGEKTDVSKLSNPAAYYAANASFNTASRDSENRNYGELDSLTASFSRLPPDVRGAVTEGNAGLSRLLDARENGYNARQYYNVYDTVKALTPADGYANVATWQKIDAVCSMNTPDTEKDYFVMNYFEGSTKDKYTAAREAGYSPYSVAVAYREYTLSKNVDLDGDGRSDRQRAFISAMMAQGASKSSAEWLYKLFSPNK